MGYIKDDSVDEQAIFDYLEELRQDGTTNMLGAAPYLVRDMGLSKDDAKNALLKWMKLHDDPARRLPAMKRRCPTCKRIYEVRRSWQRWCSDRCGNIMRLRRRQKRVVQALALMAKVKK